MTVVLAVWGASAIIGVSIYLVMTKRHKDKIVYPCDSCARLEEKRQKSAGLYRYVCKKRGGFDKPLEYCEEYTPFIEVGTNEHDSVLDTTCRSCLLRLKDKHLE